ncbi:endoplasmic reticulum vesicle transporter-domain-containing protein [Phycomyces nitens]|nr:endoplasmic reticulum vesicle transporter-domain-containing protein [Phycomyces nitens]
MLSRSFLQRFRRLDAYAKTLDDFRIRTASGAGVTIVSGLVIAILLIFEVSRFLSPTMDPEIIVDGGKSQRMSITFNATFPNLPCYLLSLDVMDESGEHISGYEHDVFKVRLDKQGNEIEKEKAKNPSDSIQNSLNQPDEGYCGPCYGANPSGVAEPCCNTCEQVQKAYTEMGWALNPDNAEQCVREGWREKLEAQSQEGCNIHGTLLVNKVRGNFHFSPGKAFAHGSAHVHDVRPYLAANHDFSHQLHSLQFGDHDLSARKHKRTSLETLTNPLDHTSWGNSESAMMYQYFLKIVPTRFDYLSGDSLNTYQYSVSRQERNLRDQSGGGLPGVFFMMDFSPMLVIYSERRKSLASFVTSVCAIVGGIFTVAGLLDGIIYRAERSYQKKRELGKTQ